MKLVKRLGVLLLLAASLVAAQESESAVRSDRQTCLAGCSGAQNSCLTASESNYNSCLNNSTQTYASCMDSVNTAREYCFDDVENEIDMCYDRCESMYYWSGPYLWPACNQDCDQQRITWGAMCDYEYFQAEDECRREDGHIACEQTRNDANASCSAAANQCSSDCYRDYP